MNLSFPSDLAATWFMQLKWSLLLWQKGRGVVQRCRSARLLLEEAADRWAEVGRGLVLHVSFSKGIAAEAGADSDAAARCLRQAAKSLLTAPLASSGHWQADHGDSESVVKLCLRGEAQSLLVVPQASLVCKLELGDKNLKYHQQCPRETAAALFEAFASALRAVARELMCTGSRHNQEAYEALAAQRAQAALVPPEEMFKQGDYEGKYSRYDDLGLPTHDKEGAELAKSAMKKLVKLREAQVKKYSKALEKRSSEPPAAPDRPMPKLRLVRRSCQKALACRPLCPEPLEAGFELTSAGPLTHAFVF
ncbi:unnamed protein product [Effrenium voratum]|nr:unnamed protein product [Effrenium voratum]